MVTQTGDGCEQRPGPIEPILDLTADEADAFMRAIGEPFRVPLHLIRVQHNIPAGLSPFRVLAIADQLRNAGGDVNEPVQVRRLDHEQWLLVEGRHRWFAAFMAGCSDVLCVEVL
jgi:hypothetical protein